MYSKIDRDLPENPAHKLTENYSHLNYQTDQLPAIVIEWMTEWHRVALLIEVELVKWGFWSTFGENPI